MLFCRKKKTRHFLLFFATILMLLAFLYEIPVFSASAEADPKIPQPSGEFFYYDEASVLSEDTRAAILAKNTELSDDSVQLVVMTVNTLPVSGYTQRVEYLRSVMQSWQVGGEQGRGLLLALSISDEDYIAVAGDALKAHFTSETIKNLLDTYLEPDFNVKSYDAGVAKFFAEAAAQAQTYAAENPIEAGAPVADLRKKKDSGSSVLLWIGLGAGAVAIICIAIFILTGRSSHRRYGSRRTVHRHTPLITPPRTNVLRHENNAPVLIKSSRYSNGIYRGRKK